MNETDVRNLIKVWSYQAKGEDPVSKFVFLWFCFNAWLAFESGKETDRQMINWLAGSGANGSRVRSEYDRAKGSSNFQDQLEALRKLSPIENSQGQKPPVQIADTDDFAGIVEAIYQIRCNLFHGRTDLKNPTEDKRIRVCGRILEKWVGNVLAPS